MSQRLSVYTVIKPGTFSPTTRQNALAIEVMVYMHPNPSPFTKKWTRAEPFKMNVKIKQGSNFDIDKSLIVL